MLGQDCSRKRVHLHELHFLHVHEMMKTKKVILNGIFGSLCSQAYILVQYASQARVSDKFSYFKNLLQSTHSWRDTKLFQTYLLLMFDGKKYFQLLKRTLNQLFSNYTTFTGTHLHLHCCQALLLRLIDFFVAWAVLEVTFNNAFIHSLGILFLAVSVK